MKRSWKILLGVATGFMLFVLVAFWQINAIGKSALETASQSALGVTMKLDRLDIRVFTGSCGLSGLLIGNPVGFDTPHFLRLRKADLAVKLGTLMQDKVALPTIHLEGLDIYLEKSKQGANYEVILDHASGGETQDEETSDEPAKVFAIHEILLRDITVHADVNLVVRERVTVEIPELRLQNVLSDDPEALSGVVRQVTSAVLAAVLETGHLPKQISDGLAIGLKGVVDVGKFGIEGVKGVSSQTVDVGKLAAEGVTGALGGAVEEIGGFFGGGRKEREDDDE